MNIRHTNLAVTRFFNFHLAVVVGLMVGLSTQSAPVEAGKTRSFVRESDCNAFSCSRILHSIAYLPCIHLEVPHAVMFAVGVASWSVHATATSGH